MELKGMDEEQKQQQELLNARLNVTSQFVSISKQLEEQANEQLREFESQFFGDIEQQILEARQREEIEIKSSNHYFSELVDLRDEFESVLRDISKSAVWFLVSVIAGWIDFGDRILALTIGDRGEFKLSWLVVRDCYNFNDTFLLLPNAMSTITIHQLESDIAQQLEQRAAQHGRTIELEIKAILKSVLAPKKPSNIDLATAII